MIAVVRKKGQTDIEIAMRVSPRVGKKITPKQLGFSDSQYEIIFLSEMPNLKSAYRHESPFPVVAGLPIVEGKVIPKYQRVAMISSWDVACGIAEYSRELLRWIEKADIIPIPQLTLKTNFDDSKYDIIHIQYEPGLFKYSQMILWDLVRKWKDAGKVIILTAHYYDDWLGEVLSHYLNHVIAHNRQFSNKENHSYLIQGCPFFAEISQKDAREKLGLPLGAKILMSFGFIMRWKQLDFVFSHFCPFIRGKNIFLQLLHSFHHRDIEEGERIKKAFKLLLEKHGLNEQVFVSHDFLNKEEINLRMQASDLGFLWKGTAISRGSSAVSKEYVAGRCPLVACQIPHYSDLWRGIEFVSPDIDIDDFCQKVIETLDDDKKLQSLRQEQEWNYENINYQKIGQWHMRLYNELLERK